MTRCTTPELTAAPRFGKNVAYTPAAKMETVTRSFTLTRLRNVLCVTLLIAAGIAALGPIGSSHAISQAGSASSEENGQGGVDLSGLIGATPLPAPSCGPCSLPIVLDENFDNVTPPALPPDWLATNALGPPPLWVTSNSGVPNPPADTPPNAAFIDDPSVVSDKRLDSLQLPRASIQLIFQQNFNLEASDVDPNVGFDGGVLEMSTDGGNTFQDILAVGGSFVMGGYNRTISSDRGSPIAGREAWSGNSQGFTTTVVNLPFSLGVARLRWRMASDNSGSGEGWRVDTIDVTHCVPVPGCSPTPRPRVTPAPRPLPSAPPSPHATPAFTPVPRPSP